MSVPVQPPLSLVAERVRRRRATVIRVVVAVVSVIALTAGVLWVFLGSTWLHIRQIEVRGTAAVAEQTVTEQVQQWLGSPLLTVDTAAAQADVTQVPAIKAVQVTRKWPRSLVVTVTERVPVGVVTAAGEPVNIDADGVTFDIADQEPSGPKIMPSMEAEEGRLARACVRVLAALPESVRGDVLQVSALSADGVELTLSKNRKVVWGSADRSDRKAQVLAALLRQRAAVYDVSAPEMPVVRNSK